MELHHAMEVEELKALVYDGQQKYSQLQTESSLNYSALLEENKRILDDYARLKDRFERILESNKKLQKNNHSLESKLLTVVENISEEKQILRTDLGNQTSKLIEAKLLIADLYEALEKYRVDCNLALQLLQSGSSKAAYQPLTKLPSELQSRIQEYLPNPLKKSSSEQSFVAPLNNTIFPTFPPTATFFTQSSGDEDSPSCVPTSDIVKLLLKPDLLPERSRKLVLCSQCLQHKTLVEAATQTDDCGDDFVNNFSFTTRGSVHHI